MSSAGLTLAQLLDRVSVERLTLGPEDILVLKVPVALSAEEASHIRNVCGERLRGVPVLILDSGMDITALRALR